jgi:hypothetical protein
LAAVRKTTAALRFSGHDLDPDEITRLFGATPTWSRRKGELVPRGGDETYFARTGIWGLRAPDGDGDNLERRIMSLLEVNSDLELWRSLAARFRGDVFVGLFMETDNEGVGLSRATLAALAERGLEIGFDIYGPVADEPETEA